MSHQVVEAKTSPLTDLATLVRGVSYTKGVEKREPTDGYVKLLRANNIQETLFFGDVLYVPKSCVKAEQILRNGDILVAMSSGSKSVVGKTAQYWESGEPTTFGAFCGVLRPIEGVDPAFLGWFLKTEQYRQFISEISAGVNINNLKREYFAQVEVPNLSPEEQKKISALIVGLLAATDSPRDRLAIIPALLKKFRQSVLAAACSGQLTADCRESNVKDWQRTTIGQLYKLIDGDRGKNYPKESDYSSDGHCLFLSTKNVRPYGFQFESMQFISKEKHQQLRGGTLERGDAVLTTRGTLGNIAIYDNTVPHEVVRVNSGMLILRPTGYAAIHTQFLKYFVASPVFAAQLSESFSGTAQPQLPARILRGFEIEVPSLREQAEIVCRVESLFAFADSIESRLAEATAQVERTTQAVLAKAFSGEL